MYSKEHRVLISFILVVGLVLGMASMGYAAPAVKPIVSAEITSISNTGIDIEYSWNNADVANHSFYYKIEKSRSMIAEANVPVDTPSTLVTDHLSIPDLTSGTYKITAQLTKNSKVVTKDTYTYRYTAIVAPTSFTVTFSETNDLEGVGIQVYSDPALTTMIGGLLTTDATGEANIDLQNGTYYYKATKTGYQDYKTDSFTVADATVTESFTMEALLYTATFREANGLEGVSVQVYSDAGFTATVGAVLTTNTSGDAITSLPNGDYYIKATMATYYDFLADIPLTILDGSNIFGFTMIPANHTVTFQESNNLADIAIQFYSDGTYTTPVSLSGTTDASGSAVFYDMPHGEYWWKGTLNGYQEYTGNFMLMGDTTVNFTMLLAFVNAEVTFAEANSLSDVSIYLYNSYTSMNPIMDALVTDSSGQAIVSLPIDSQDPYQNIYYYRANREGYDEWGGSFTVSTDTINIAFTMGTTENALFTEDFSGVADGALPDGWSTEDPTLVYVNTSRNSWGNSTMELYIDYGPLDVVSQYRAATPAIDCTTATSLTLAYDQYIDHYDDVNPYTLRVQVSTDGGVTWSDIKVYEPTLDTVNAYTEIGPETVRFDLSAYAGETIMIGWSAEGYTYHLDRWCIDDIYLTGTGGSNLHTVTFAETTSLAGVTVEILGMTDHSFFGSTSTDENGIATYALADGDYYVSLMKAGYEYYWYNSILVAGEPLLYEFAMVDKGADYTVTFENATALADIEIQIFDNQEWYTVWLSTDASGVATTELPNGTYRFGANKTGYDTFVNGFTVGDAATTVAIDMVSTPATAESLPFLEDFSGFEQDGFPDGWITNYPTNWLVNYGESVK